MTRKKARVKEEKRSVMMKIRVKNRCDAAEQKGWCQLVKRMKRQKAENDDA